MARRPKPWWREQRNAWFAIVRGKYRKLAEGKEGYPAALSELKRLLEDADVPAKAVPAVLKVRRLAEVYLDHVRDTWAPGTYESYTTHLAAFVRGSGDMLAAEVKPFHLTTHLAGAKVAESTRSIRARVVKGMFTWAHRQGLLETHPLKDFRLPRPPRRAKVMSREEAEKVLAHVKEPRFHDLLVTLWETGARIGELCGATAADFDPANGTITVNGKTSRVTGDKRVIYLGARSKAIVEGLARQHPTGALFRNTEGNPWNRHAIRTRFQTIRKQLGFDKGTNASALRSRFITDALVQGVEVATVAKLVGHRRIATTVETYSRLEMERKHLADTARAIRGDACTSGPGTASDQAEQEGPGVVPPPPPLTPDTP